MTFFSSINSYAKEDSAAEIGKKLADPTSLVWALFTEFDLTWSDGDLTNGTETSEAIIFQPVMPFLLTKDWKLLTRPTLPVLSRSIPRGFNSDGSTDFKTYSGIGNLSLPLLFSPAAASPSGFAWGLGPTLTFPTASRAQLGSDTWEIGPAALGLYKNKQITTGALGQYWWSYAEQRDSASTSHGTFLYFAYYNLPNAWQIGTSPTITYNDKADSDNKWNVPVGLMVAKTIFIGKTPFKFQFGIEYSVVNEDIYGKEWLIKLNIIPVISALFPDPLF